MKQEIQVGTDMSKYKAIFQSSNQDFKTNYYPTKEEAQDALMKRCGNFHYLGAGGGDGKWDNESYCSSAPRNGGTVSIEEKEDK